MAYASEEMSEADQKRVGCPALRDGGGRLIAPYMWTVDRTTGNYLIESNNRDRDDPHESRFGYGWKGRQFRFSAVAETKGEVSSGLCWTWRLTDEADMPPATSPDRALAIAELKVALAAHSAAVHPVKEVSFDF